MGSQEKTGFRTDEPVAFARKESNSRDTNVNTPERMPVPLPAPLRAILYKNRELLQLSQQCLQRPCTIITNNYSGPQCSNLFAVERVVDKQNSNGQMYLQIKTEKSVFLFHLIIKFNKFLRL